MAHVAIIYATAPFLAAGLGWLVLREAPSRSSTAACHRAQLPRDSHPADGVPLFAAERRHLLVLRGASGRHTPGTLLLALFGIVNFAVGLPLFTYGARLLPAVETALIGAVDAPPAPLWVWLAFGEVPTLSTIVGGCVVFVAVAAHLVVSETWAARA